MLWKGHRKQHPKSSYHRHLPFIGLKGDEAEWLSCNVFINLGLCMSSLAYLVHDSKAESAHLVGDQQR
jgi:hypothetical protein